jgi:hypothetical protein
MNIAGPGTASTDSPGTRETGNGFDALGLWLLEREHRMADQTNGTQVIAVLLAGTLAPSPLRTALGVLPLCLPFGATGTLLDAWLGVIDELDVCSQVRVLVNTAEDIASLQSVMPRGERTRRGRRIMLVAEPASWRGAAGVMFDATVDLGDDQIILVIEAHSMPPASVAPVMTSLADDLAGVVAVAQDRQPAGMYVFRRSALHATPRVGYFDMKEQLIPKLAGGGGKLGAVQVDHPCIRIRDRRSYLAAVRERAAQAGSGQAASRVSRQAAVSGSAVLSGVCIIEDGVVVEDGALVHDSVVLSGATIGGGAILSRSIVAPLTRVAPRAKIIRGVVSPDATEHGPVQSALRARGR